MSYGKVKDTFWTDKKVKSFSDDAKMLALYLMTGPHRNMLGCMLVPDGYILADLKWSQTRLSNAIAMLSERQFICRDDDGWTLILNQLKHDPLKVPNHAKAAIALADEVPSDSVVYQELVPRLTAALDAIGMASSWHPKDIAIPVPSPSPLPNPSPEPIPAGAVDISAEFEIWYLVYPRKKSPGAALKAYRAARKKVDAETLLIAAERYRDDPNRDPKFTKYPENWLNAECWRDEAVTETAKSKTMQALDELERRLGENGHGTDESANDQRKDGPPGGGEAGQGVVRFLPARTA